VVELSSITKIGATFAGVVTDGTFEVALVVKVELELGELTVLSFVVVVVFEVKLGIGEVELRIWEVDF